MATWNIWDDRSAGLPSVARSLGMMGIDLAFLIETKFTNTDFATKRCTGYDILTATAGSNNCGGVALLVREDT